MGFCLCSGGMLSCPFGASPAPLQVMPTARVMAGGMAAGGLMDSVPMMNIPTFGMCNNPANPAVAAATAAKLGVLTPVPCVPVPAGPWLNPSPKVLIGGKPALTDGSKLMCAWGGQISVQFAGQTGVQL